MQESERTHGIAHAHRFLHLRRHRHHCRNHRPQPADAVQRHRFPHPAHPIRGHAGQGARGAALRCGGRGTRLQEKTVDIPKPLVEIGGKPILWHVVQLYAAQGFRRFVLLTGYKGELIESFAQASEIPFVYLDRPYYLEPHSRGDKVYALYEVINPDMPHAAVVLEIPLDRGRHIRRDGPPALGEARRGLALPRATAEPGIRRGDVLAMGGDHRVLQRPLEPDLHEGLERLSQRREERRDAAHEVADEMVFGPVSSQGVIALQGRDTGLGFGAGRFAAFSQAAPELFADLSKNLIDAEAQALLRELARECGLEAQRDAMFAGERINHTENRAVKHWLLRNADGSSDPDAAPVRETLDAMLAYAEQVRADAALTDVVNIGIGGSDLGPQMAVAALEAFGAPGKRLHFVSNIDGHELASVLGRLDAGRTLFLVASKTFTTLETMTNARSARDWFGRQGAQDVARPIAALTTRGGALGVAAALRRAGVVRVRRQRAAPRGGRPLQRDRVHGRAAGAGVRHPSRPRRCSWPGVRPLEPGPRRRRRTCS